MNLKHPLDLPYCFGNDYGGNVCKQCGFKEDCYDKQKHGNKKN
jgi:hypothetical protein